MIKYIVGDVVIVYEGTKLRPTVIINNGLGIDVDVSTARVSSQKVRNEFDVSLVYWKEAGLEKPSIVRCSKINTVTPGKQMLKIGSLHIDDLSNVRDAVNAYIKSGFEVF